MYSSSSCRYSDEDSSPDGSNFTNFSLTVPQHSFWSRIAANLENLIENNIPEHEYEMLEEEFFKPTKDQSVGKLSTNRTKNRYTNILPYDDTRVKLTLINGEDSSDYINADFVGPNLEYVAAQAPVPTVINDFWRMIVENNVKIIVMLTKEYEGSKIKSHRYWPNEGSETYGNYIVTHLSEDTYPDFTIREFIITSPNGDELRTIQYHYLSWPDHSVPNSSASLIEIMENIDSKLSEIKCNTNPKNNLVVTHCSAGIGRTGAFILLHLKLKMLKHYYNIVDSDGNCEVPSVSLMDALRELRQQRHGMITQKCQYDFCYKTLLDEVHKLANQETSTE